MLEWAKENGIDLERLHRQREVLVHLGLVYRNEAKSSEKVEVHELLLLAAATNYRRAGARKYFYEACTIYRTLKSPYAFLLENLSERNSAERAWSEEISEVNSVYYLWRSFDVKAVQTLEVSREPLESFRTKRIGVLGIELGAYVDLFESVSNKESKDDQIRETLLPILTTYALAVKRAMRDRYHWTRSIAAFHPAEPDVLALLVSLDNRLTVRESSVAHLIQGLPIDPALHSLLRGTLGQFNAWRDKPAQT